MIIKKRKNRKNCVHYLRSKAGFFYGGCWSNVRNPHRGHCRCKGVSCGFYIEDPNKIKK
jgi:hypothetical protein